MTSSSYATPGTVYIVGAGPGNPDFVTERARQLIATADVVLYDRLIPHALLRPAPADAELVNVGKRAADHAMPQDQINDELVRYANEGKVVVRLTSGDPYLFGYGGEEALQCRRHGVRFEVVPAVTSALSAAASAGIPVTHSDISRHVTIVSASAESTSADDPNYAWLAGSDGTLVVLMGLRRIAHIASQLIEHGMPGSRPVAVISRGTSPQQRTVTGSLSTIAAEAQRAELASPAIVVVGDVVELRDQLAWFEERPLFGRRIAVTRARAQASELAARLHALGAEVLETPAILIEDAPVDDLDALCARLDDTSLLVFTSRNGVDRFFDRLIASGRDARALARTQIAVVGGATAAACRARGVMPDIVPAAGQQTGRGLLQLLGKEPLYGTRVAVVRAEHGDDSFLEGLAALGTQVELVVAYRTLIEEPDEAAVQQLLECDMVTFTSESTVRNVSGWIPRGAALPPSVTIGPITTKAALWHGFRVLSEAAEPSIEALVDAVLDNIAERGTLPA